jgi:hypothetical protein
MALLHRDFEPKPLFWLLVFAFYGGIAYALFRFVMRSW